MNRQLLIGVLFATVASVSSFFAQKYNISTKRLIGIDDIYVLIIIVILIAALCALSFLKDKEKLVNL